MFWGGQSTWNESEMFSAVLKGVGAAGASGVSSTREINAKYFNGVVVLVVSLQSEGQNIFQRQGQ